MRLLDGPQAGAVGVVYFARRESTGTYKIGTTWNPRNRLFDFRCLGIRDLEMVALVRGGNMVEARIHAFLEPYHIGHEWFSPDIAHHVDAIAAEKFDWAQLPNPGWCITKPFQTKASLAHWGPLPRKHAA